MTRLAAALLPLLCGCSFSMVDGPPSPAPAQATRIECTESRTVPVIDTSVAAVSAAFAIAAFVNAGKDCGGDGDTDSCEISKKIAPMFGTVFAISTALWASSAAVGFRRTSECRDARSRLALPSSGAPGQLSADEVAGIRAIANPR